MNNQLCNTSLLKLKPVTPLWLNLLKGTRSRGNAWERARRHSPYRGTLWGNFPVSSASPYPVSMIKCTIPFGDQSRRQDAFLILLPRQEDSSNKKPKDLVIRSERRWKTSIFCILSDCIHQQFPKFLLFQPQCPHIIFDPNNIPWNSYSDYNASCKSSMKSIHVSYLEIMCLLWFSFYLWWPHMLLTSHQYDDLYTKYKK